MFIGIDNGHSGAIVTLSTTGNVQRIERTPSLKAGKANHTQFDFVTASELAAGWKVDPDVRVALEKSQPMPRRLRGGNSSFSTALVYGGWQGILAAHQISFIIVSAADWQNRFLRGAEGRDSKAQSVFAARRAQPAAPWPKAKAELSAAADAFWLAEYCRRYWTGGAKMEA